MKLAIAGKGGVGKTLISGTLSRLLARDGYKVLAIDADPAMNLAYSLGISSENASKIVPITENDQLIEDKTGVKSGNEFGPLFKLAPSVDDIADKYGIVGPDNVKLLVMGTVRGGGSGCMCPANALIRALIRHVTLEKKDIVIMDMEAGLEHLGRATVRGFNALICVTEPGTQSIETAQKIKRLSADIDVNEILAVGNKILEEEDRQFVEHSLDRIELEMVGIIPYDRAVLRADALRIAPLDFSPTSPAVEAIKKIKMTLLERYS